MFKLLLITELIAHLSTMGGNPSVVEKTDTYTKIAMADSCTWEVLSYPDSICVVQTVCAPICSSNVRIYDKKWEAIHEVTPPFSNAVFPYAHIENGKIIWEDNTSLILDEQETNKP